MFNSCFMMLYSSSSWGFILVVSIALCTECVVAVVKVVDLFVSISRLAALTNLTVQ